MPASITFSADSEAHWSVYKAIAEREYVVKLDDRRVMVVGAGDEGLTVVDYPRPVSRAYFVPYACFETCEIL